MNLSNKIFEKIYRESKSFLTSRKDLMEGDYYEYDGWPCRLDKVNDDLSVTISLALPFGKFETKRVNWSNLCKVSDEEKQKIEKLFDQPSTLPKKDAPSRDYEDYTCPECGTKISTGMTECPGCGVEII